MTTLQKGDQAPSFSGVDQDGKTHQLADYAGKKLVVFFYPKANTPGCTAEACDLRDNYARFEFLIQFLTHCSSSEVKGVPTNSICILFADVIVPVLSKTTVSTLANCSTTNEFFKYILLLPIIRELLS